MLQLTECAFKRLSEIQNRQRNVCLMEKAHKRLPIPLMSLGQTIFRQFSVSTQVSCESKQHQGYDRLVEYFNQILICWKFIRLRNKRIANTNCEIDFCESQYLNQFSFHSRFPFYCFLFSWKMFTFFWLSLWNFFHCLCTD